MATHMTEAEQIEKLNKELQKLQELIRELNLRPNKGMNIWERFIIYIVLIIYAIPSSIFWLVWLFE